MASFQKYITACGAKEIQGDKSTLKVGRFELFRILRKYPWFTTARMIRTKLYNQEDERVYLAQLFPMIESSHSEGELREEIEHKVVDKFLSLGKYSITRPDEDGRAESLVLEHQIDEDDDEFHTEELAQIYANQGLFAEARNIYLKLSLRDTKKSVYFAEIIARLDEKIINN